MKIKQGLIIVCVLGVLASAAWAENAAAIPSPRTKVFKGGQTWTERHEAVNEQAVRGEAELVFLGDSITHYWETEGAERWEKSYAPYKAIDMGFSGDQVGHLLWRIQNGALKGISPKVAVLMIGTNNSRDYNPEEVGGAIRAICAELHAQLPETKILLLAIFPRGTADDERHLKNVKTNELISGLGDEPWVEFLDIGASFTDPAGNVRKELFPDGLHPNTEGYAIWGEAMKPTLDRMMGD